MHFFLGNDEGSEDSDDESDDDVGSCLQKKIFPCSTFGRQLTSDLSSISVKSRKRPAAATTRFVRSSRQQAKFGHFYLILRHV